MRPEEMVKGVLWTLSLLALAITGFSLARSGGADPLPTRHVVEIRNLRFQPEELTVTEGDTVVWINGAIVPHTVSALTDEWHSGELVKDARWTWVAGSTGRHRYYCEYHPTMRGSVVVRGIRKGN